QDKTLACVVCWGDFGQVCTHNSEIWKSFTYGRKLACGLCWIGLKSYISHAINDTSVFTSWPGTIFLSPPIPTKTTAKCAARMNTPASVHARVRAQTLPRT